MNDPHPEAPAVDSSKNPYESNFGIMSTATLLQRGDLSSPRMVDHHNKPKL